MNYDFRLLFLYFYIVVTFYVDNIMKDFLKENSKYKIVAKLSIISVTTLLMIFAGTATFIHTIIQCMQLQRTQLHPHRLQH